MDLISEEITGVPVPVTIAGQACALSYPLHNLLLFKKRTGLSLFVRENWDQLDFEDNYDVWIECLWAGLHRLGADARWTVPFTKPQLEPLIGFRNAYPLHNAMVEALTNWMPRPRKTADADSEKKSVMREDPGCGMTVMEPIETTSPASGFAPDEGLVLPAQNS